MDVHVALVICVVLMYTPCGEGTTFDEKFQKLEGILDEIRTRNVVMARQISDVENLVVKSTGEIKTLQDKVVLLKDTEQYLADEIHDVKNKLYHSVERNVPENQKRQLHTPTVCFTAVISKTDLTNLRSGQPIVFDQAITNVGDAYNVTSGEFTAPIGGLYLFNMDILVEQGENEYLEFVKDNVHVMYNYAHASGALHDESSSREVVLELKSGNRVWVQTSSGTHHGSGNLHGNGFSTFSGWLLAITE